MASYRVGVRLCTESEYLYALAIAREKGGLEKCVQSLHSDSTTVVWTLNSQLVAEKTSFLRATIPTEYVINSRFCPIE